MLKKGFKQAAEGRTSGVLANIRRAEINLAVWHDPLSPAAKAYLAGLDVRKIVRGKKWEDGYYRSAGRLRASSTESDRAQAVADLLKELPRGAGRRALARDINKLVATFTEAAAAGKKVTGSLLVFRPEKDGGGFWHADSDYMRGIITLKGDKGTLWAPDDARLKQKDRKGIYWGAVKPLRQKFIQEIAPQDFAAFKCLPNPNPLRHATPAPPMSNEYRLTLILGVH